MRKKKKKKNANAKNTSTHLQYRIIYVHFKTFKLFVHVFLISSMTLENCLVSESVTSHDSLSLAESYVVEFLLALGFPQFSSAFHQFVLFQNSTN